MMILIEGASASGKSAWAEEKACQLAKKEYLELIYIATMMPFGKDALQKIERHHLLRKGKGFQTIEQYTDVGMISQEKLAGKVVLLECMSNLLANELYKEKRCKEIVFNQIKRDIQLLKTKAAHLLIVTLNVFEDGIIYDDETEFFREYLGKLNSWLAKESDLAVEIVYGIPIIQKEIKDERIMDCDCNVFKDSSSAGRLE